MDPTNGNGVPSAPQGTDAPEALTRDDVVELVNRAITGRLQDYGKRQEKHLSTILETFTSKLDEKFSPPPTDEKPSNNIQDHPEFKGVLKRQQEMEQRLKAADEEKALLKAKSLDQSLRQRLADELTKAGIDPKLLRHASGLLVDADKRVRWSEDGDKMVWRDDEGADLDLTTGLKAWAKSDDAKPYLPPRGVSGSGGAPGTSTPGKPNGDMNNDASLLLMKHLTGG